MPGSPPLLESIIPFYSIEVRETLLKIIKNHKEYDEEEKKNRQDDVRNVAAVRGKWRRSGGGGGGGYNVDSLCSSDDDDDNYAVDKYDDDEDDDSLTSTTSTNNVSSAKSVHVNDDCLDNNSDKYEEKQHNPQYANSGSEDTHGAKLERVPVVATHSRTKKSRYKIDDKSALLQRMGHPPSIFLPIDAIPLRAITSTNTNDSTKQPNKSSSFDQSNSNDITGKAIELPSVLLPMNYLRDNPNWKVSHAAQLLLSSWEKLNNSATSLPSPTILVILLQSGRFASAVYSPSSAQAPLNQPSKNSSHHHHNHTTMTMIAHKTSTRYTVRKGQGGSQSNFDQSKHKAKSMGAQLRREGERQLRQDVHDTWKVWKQLGYVQSSVVVYVSCPKSMRRDYLYTTEDDSIGLLEKKDDRWRNIPLDVGRPTLNATSAVLECLMRCNVREMTEEEFRNRLCVSSSSSSSLLVNEEDEDKISSSKNMIGRGEEIKTSQESVATIDDVAPYTPLHEAILEGDMNQLRNLLDLLNLKESQEVPSNTNAENSSCVVDPCHGGSVLELIDYDINSGSGPDGLTPLHIASSSTHPDASLFIMELLMHGHANPCAVDRRGRPPYFLAASDKHRECFRIARGSLGEDYCPWDEGAKVGPALSESDLQMKKKKALEKKQRQRARQKESRAIEKMEAERIHLEEQARLHKLKEEEDAKRIRDGLQPKKCSTTSISNSCDFCQKIAKGKRRSQMYQRLDYVYCSTECVKRHQRELIATAATARLQK